LYNPELIDHFTNPRHAGRLPDADALGVVGHDACGDQLWLYLKVEGERLARVGFEIFGCPAAVATASAFCELITGLTLDEALDVRERDIVAALGGLPPEKIHCSLLAINAYRQAVTDYILGGPAAAAAAAARAAGTNQSG
jgi:nitrogen fixation protein NifU and related proteins